MYFFDLALEDRKRNADQAQSSTTIIGDDVGMWGPGGFFGTSLWGQPKEISKGALGVANDITGTFYDAVIPTLKGSVGKGIDSLFDSGTSAQDFLEQYRTRAHRIAETLKPDQNTGGYLGQIVNGLVRTGGKAAIGGVLGGPAGAAALVGGTEANLTMQEAHDKGVDSATAMGLGAIAGITGAAGVYLPASLPGRTAVSLGTGTVHGAAAAMGGALSPAFAMKLSPALANVGFGASANAAQGMAQRGATSALLDQAGYNDMARQYQALDANAMIADAVLGGLFGYAGYRHQKSLMEPIRKGEFKPEAQDFDAALAMNNQHHLEVDTAPGLNPTPEARSTHIDALVQATKDLLAGDPVNVGAKPGMTGFIDNPHASAKRAEIGRAVEKHLGEDFKAALKPEETSARRAPETLPPLPEGVRIVSEGGSFGHALEGFAGRWPEARAWLENAKFGEVLDVLTHPEINDRIGLPYGAWDGKNGYGLAKLIGKHPEVLDNLPEILSGMQVTSRSNNRIRLESADHSTAVALQHYDSDKTWLITAYEKRDKGDSGDARYSRGLHASGADQPSPRLPNSSSGRAEESRRLPHPAAPRLHTNLNDQSIAHQRETGNIDPYSPQRIVEEKPHLTVLDEEGKPVSARELLARHDEDISIANEESHAYDVAVACALRNDL